MKLEITPRSRFEVNTSTGYTVYAAILSLLSNRDDELATQIHDTNRPAFHCSGLAGTFDNSAGKHTKYVLPEETYYVDINFYASNAKVAYQYLFDQFVRSDNDFELTNGKFDVVSASADTRTHEEIYTEASDISANRMWFNFVTPACINDGEDVTAMVPHRGVVFRSLHASWNANSDYPLPRDSNVFVDNLIEKPDEYNLRSCSVMTARMDGLTDDDEDAHGDAPPRKLRQGFTGRFGYQFKDASEDTKTLIRALALYAEVVGIGQATSRGCGVVTTEFERFSG